MLKIKKFNIFTKKFVSLLLVSVILAGIFLPAAPTPVYAAPGPDLITRNIAVAGEVPDSSTVYTGSTVSVVAEVYNDGDQGAAGLAVDFAVFDSASVQVGSTQTQSGISVAAGVYSPVSFSWTAPAIPGSYTLRLTTDPAGQMEEANKSNNTAELTVSVIKDTFEISECWVNDNADVNINGGTWLDDVKIGVTEVSGSGRKVFAAEVPESGKLYSFGNSANPNSSTWKARVKIAGSLPAGVTVSKIKKTVMGTAALEELPAECYTGKDGKFEVFLMASPQYSGMGAVVLYFTLSDRSTRVFILDTDIRKYVSSGYGTYYAPSFVGLYNVTTGELLDPEYQFITSPETEKTTGRSYTRAAFTGDPATLSVVVHNEVPALTVFLKGSSTYAQLDSPADMQTNSLVVNGVPLGKFSGGSESGEKYGPNFTLKAGLNIIEVSTNFQKMYPVSGSTFAPYSPNRTNAPNGMSTVYLVDWAGEEIAPAPRDNSDTSVDYIKVFQYAHAGQVTNEEKPFTLFPVYKTGDNTYTASLGGLVTNTTTTTPGRDIVIFNIKPADGMAVFDAVYDSVTGQPSNAPTIDKAKTAGSLNPEGGFVFNGFTTRDITGLGYFGFDIVSADGSKREHYTVNLIKKSRDCDLMGIHDLSGNPLPLLDMNLANTTFSKDVTRYYLNYPNNGSSFNFIPVVSDSKATVSLNGVNILDFATTGVTLLPDRSRNEVTVTAEDGLSTKSYYFSTCINGVLPASGISDATKALARQMLSGWYTDLETRKDFSGDYWDVFMAKATGGADFNGAMVYDVTKKEIKQATDAAACILQLVMLGENPYNFRGKNYVAELEKFSGGSPFANNIWYLVAAKAAGIDLQFEASVRGLASNSNADLDMRGWAIAALSGIAGPAELAALADGLHDRQITSGDYISLFRNIPSSITASDYNLYTIGCVLTALAAGGSDPETNFALDGHTPLATIQSKFIGVDGKFQSPGSVPLYPKDMIVGLGDLIHESNVWVRQALTRAKYDALTAKAATLGVSEANSMPIYGAEGYGQAYYDLYDKVVAKLEDNGNTAEARAMRPDVQYGNLLQSFINIVNSLPGTVTLANEATLESAMAIYEGQLTAQQKVELITNSKAAYDKYMAALATVIGLKTDGTAAKAAFEKIVVLPTPSELSPSAQAAVNEAKSAYDALTEDQKGYIDWAGASFKVKLEDCVRIMAAIAPGGGVKSVTVTFRLVGDSIHDSPENHTQYVNWIPKTTYTFYGVDSVSVYEVFMRAIRDNGFQQEGAESNYVRGINNGAGWLREFDNGPTSGWMYMVNNVHPQEGLQNWYVVNGDRITWHYIDDLEIEEGMWEKAGEGIPAGPGRGARPVDPITPATSPTVGENAVSLTPKVTSIAGEATVVLSTASLESILASAIEKKSTGIVIAPEITGEAKKVSVELPKASVSSVAADTAAALTVRTPVGNVTIPNSVLGTIATQAAGDNITVSLESVSIPSLAPAQQAAVGASPVYDISIVSGSKSISSFGGGSISISLPYTLKEGENPAGVTIWYLNDAGELEKMTCTYDGTTGMATFSTNHLSYYVVGYEAAPVEWKNPFTDVKATDWFYKNVEFAVQKGLFSGTAADTFSPGASMTRAMLVTVLYRLEGSPAVSGTNGFTDVRSGEWYTNAVIWANAKGIVTGYGDGLFGTNDSITREQMAVILYNYATLKGYDVARSADLEAFTDAEGISGWALNPMKWANSEGLITGRTTDTLAPKGSATRAEVAAILQRFMESLEK